MGNHAATAASDTGNDAPASYNRWRLIALFAPALAVAAIILLRASLTYDGYLSADSRFYLAAASNFAHGLGWRLANDGSAPAALEPFADWPVGYPALISLFASATGLSAFTAAKGLGVALVLAVAGVIGRTFGRDGPACALPLAFASTLENFSYTWSEVPFVALLVAVAALLASSWLDQFRHPLVRAVLLWACCAGLFLCRYVGAFAVVIPALAGLPALWRRDWRAALPNLLALVATAAVVAIYLRNNAELTGYLTGMPRDPPTDAPWRRFAMLARAIWDQLVVDVPPVTGINWRARAAATAIDAIALLAVVRTISRHNPAPMRRLKVDRAAAAFFTVGLLYLAAIIVLRWCNQFDPYNFRLLGPGTLLVWIGLMRVALTSWPAARWAIVCAATTLALVSFAFALAALPRPWQLRYPQVVNGITQRYAALPPGSIIVFGSSHLHYLRSDLFVAMPLCPPWFAEHETWVEFTQRLDHSRPIYLDRRLPLSALSACDASIRTAVAAYPAGRIAPLIATPPQRGIPGLRPRRP